MSIFFLAAADLQLLGLHRENLQWRERSAAGKTLGRGTFPGALSLPLAYFSEVSCMMATP